MIKKVCMHALIPNDSFELSSEIFQTHFSFFKTLNSEFSYIEVWFTGHNY